MIIYIRDVQNFDFGQAFSKEGNCILSLAQQIATIVPAYSPIDMVCYVKNMDIADIKGNTAQLPKARKCGIIEIWTDK